MTYLSINIYTFSDLRHKGAQIIDIVDALFALWPEHLPVKFSADLVHRKRSRFFKVSPKNLLALKRDLSAGIVRELILSDNEGSELIDPRTAYDVDKYNLAFSLDLTKPIEKMAHDLRAKPNQCQFLIRIDALRGQDVTARLLSLSKTAFSTFSASWGDMYVCGNSHACFEHLIGIRQTHYRRTAQEEFKTMVIDRGPFFDDLCGTLVRDAYFGVFLNHAHVRLLGGMQRLRRELTYEVIEDLPDGGAFLMASSNPLDFGDPKIKYRVEQLGEFLMPISMLQVSNRKEARQLADGLQDKLLEGNGL